jgi:hypothetical protein
MQVPRSQLASEADLEAMIVAAPAILSDEWMLIGRQEDTGFGGRADLLLVAPDGTLVLVELKRNKTPRDVIAQVLDYASWLQRLTSNEIVAIYTRFRPDRSLATDFHDFFGQELDEDSLNAAHEIVVVAASLDASTERIVQYLNNRNVPINILFFQVFEHGGQQLLSRAWFLDPREVQLTAASGVDPKNRTQEPWNGEFYVNFGDAARRNWEEARQYGFVSAGGRGWFSNTLALLNEGDRIWVNIPGTGYVGVGRVAGAKTAASDFRIDGQPALDVLTAATYHRDVADDPERAEYFVPVRWLQTVPTSEAVREVGFFGNQNTVCKPKTPSWRSTVEALKRRFPGYADEETGGGTDEQ